MPCKECLTAEMSDGPQHFLIIFEFQRAAQDIIINIHSGYVNAELDTPCLAMQLGLMRC